MDPGGIRRRHAAEPPTVVVAEQFAVLDALYPGRIALGIGRSSGFTAPVRRALRHDRHDADTFGTDLAELRSHLDGRGPVTVRPRSDQPVPLFVLATGRGLAVAGDAGPPAVVGGPVLWSEDLPRLLADYRTRAERAGALPYLVAAVDVLIADSVPAASELALPEAWALAYARAHGEFPRSSRPTRTRLRSIGREPSWRQAWPPPSTAIRSPFPTDSGS